MINFLFSTVPRDPGIYCKMLNKTSLTDGPVLLIEVSSGPIF